MISAMLSSRRAIVVAGTGGVGKTTISAAMGVQAAEMGKKVLVLTIDPAHRLAQALGLDTSPGVAVQVPGVSGLYAAMIDARKEFDAFVLGSVGSKIANGLMSNRLYQQLASNLSGSQEFTSLVRFVEAVDGEKYDLVILDTPPMQNAEEFFAAPDRLYALFSDSVMSWFIRSDANDGLVKKIIHRSTRLVTAALESVTGSVFIAELSDFFIHVSHLKSRIREISVGSRSLLRDPNTGFVLVTGFDEAKLKETFEFQRQLSQENYNLVGVIVNRWFPDWPLFEGQTDGKWRDQPGYAKLEKFYRDFSQYFQLRREMFEDLVERLGHEVPTLRLPDYKQNIQGLSELRMMSARLEEL